jgi:membrane protein involved in colicin uptake
VIEFTAQTDPRLMAILEGIHGAHHVLFNEMADTVITCQQSAPIPQHVPQQPQSADNSKLLLQVGNLEHELQKLRQDKENLLNTIEQERHEAQEQMTMLQEENSKYLNTIIKHSKENAENNLGTRQTMQTTSLE